MYAQNCNNSLLKMIISFEILFIAQLIKMADIPSDSKFATISLQRVEFSRTTKVL